MQAVGTAKRLKVSPTVAFAGGGTLSRTRDDGEYEIKPTTGTGPLTGKMVALAAANCGPI